MAKSKAKAAAVDDVSLAYWLMGAGAVLVLIGLLGVVALRRLDAKAARTRELAGATPGPARLPEALDQVAR